MPGIVGFLSGGLAKDVIEDSVKKMQELITHKSFYKLDPVFFTGNVCATRSHIDVFQTARQPFSKNYIHIWLDGEIHNKDEMIDDSSIDIQSAPELLYDLYQKDQKLSFLSKIDGGYSAVIFDELNHKLHLISDRYARQHLYWTQYENGIAWASELKAFSAIPGFNVEIDPLALEEFLGMGYMLDEQTWLKEVKSIPASTFVTINTKSFESFENKYWKWDQISSLNISNGSIELAEQVGDLFIKAVEKQSRLNDENIGITLSGGRDSRAVLAAMPDNGEPIRAVTYGKKNCMDIHYASKAINIKKGIHIHRIYELNASNWLFGRMKSIWWTDGQVSFVNLNGATGEHNEISIINTSFVGLGGEVLAGKCKLFEMDDVANYVNKKFINPHITDRLKNRLIHYIKQMSSPEAYSLNHRFMKFSTLGLKRGEATGVRVRVPFLDNRLVEFILSIPGEYKEKAKLYDTMLILKFPEYFKDLGWEHLDLSVGLNHKFYYYLKKINKRLRRNLAKFGIGEELSTQLADYSAWIRQDPARSFFKDLLCNDRALYPEHIDRSVVIKCLNKHLTGENNAIMLCRYVTFEIWLQQLFNKRLRE